jgi:hypothetical protein
MSNFLHQIKYLILLLLFLISPACTNEKNINEFWKACILTADKNISILKIEMENIEIDISNTSGVGKWVVKDDNLIFMDELYSSMYHYDLEFNYLRRMLGRGNGPEEIQGRIVGHALYKDKIFILGPSYDFYEVNFAGEVINKGYLNFETGEIPFNKLENEPKPDYQAIYEVEYAGLAVDYLNEDEIMFSITSSHPLFNPYSSIDYYREARTFGLLNLKENKIKNIFGRISPVYQEYEFIPYLSYLHVNVVEDNEYLIGYEADSLIYFFDGIDNIKYAFGRKGRNMDMNYPQVNDYERYVEIHKEYRPKYGYFTFLKHFSANKMTFRGYQKDNFKSTDGMQIYRENILIGDVDVPNGFRIIGFFPPYYYGAVYPSEEIGQPASSMIIYRFEL